jgi:hypothetical protein
VVFATNEENLKAGTDESVSAARRAVAAGGALFRDGLIAEAHAAVSLALERLLLAWSRKTEAKTAEDTPAQSAFDALAAAGYPRLERLKAAHETATAPSSNDVSMDVEWVWAETERLLSFTARARKSPAERKRQRVLLAVAAGALVIVGLLTAFRIWVRPRVVASDAYGPGMPGSFAFDGLETTEWVLPDGKAGWLDIMFRFPRSITAVTIVNGHNRHYLDRASAHVRVEAFTGDRSLASGEARFSKVTPERSAQDVALTATGVTRVRVEVLAWHGVSGALAEIELR